MKIQQAIHILDGLSSQTEKRSERKTILSLRDALKSLEDRSLNADELHSIEDALDQIVFSTGTEPTFKELKRNRSRFMKFLREEFSLTAKGYFTSLGICLGLAFGAAFSPIIQSVTGGTLPFGATVAIGMVIGMSVGIMKDNDAERQNRVLQTEPLV